MANIPTVTFNNGNKFPIFGLGTWQSKPGEVAQAVKDAIDAGYRHIDCAHLYGNEKEVGEAIAAKISEGIVRREDLYVTSKLWNIHHRPGAVEPALKVTLKDLGLDYVDLYLIHWPMGFKEGDDNFPKTSDGKIFFSDVDFVDTWKAMEEVYKKGLAKSVGVSNFNREQIERLLKTATVVPVTNQVECSIFLNQKELSEYCRSKGITITAYSPLGTGSPQILENPKLQDMAAKYKKSPAQILIRYQVQKGHIVIPKTVTKKRILENVDVFDFGISDDDMKYLDSLNCNLRTIKVEESLEHPYYPFHAKF